MYSAMNWIRVSLGVGLNGPVPIRLIVFRDTPARTVNAACNRPHKTTHSRQDSSAILFFTAFVNRAIVSDGGSGYNRDRSYSTEIGGIVIAFGGNPADAVRNAGGQWV